MLRFAFLLLLAGVILSACNLKSGQTVAHAPAAEAANLRLNADAATAIPRATATPLPRLPARATPISDASSRCLASDAAHPARQISAAVSIDYAAKTASVDQQIRFANREDEPLQDLILDVQANQWEGAFALQSLRINGMEAAYALDANQLRMPLPTPLLPGCALDLALSFQLTVAPIRDGLRAYRGFFGYSPRQLNLAHFLPTVAARIDGAWRIHPPSGIGEQIVHELADWQVAFSVTNAPASIGLAAPGEVVALDSGEWLVTLQNARDFAVSFGEDFFAHSAKTSSGVAVDVFAFDDDSGLNRHAAERALGEIVKALTFFERRYGAYPRDRFVIVQGDFPDGMEFSGIVFVSSAWFADYNGTHKNYLTLVSVHELAHQWFYSQVGSDAAMHPWLDEALATYSEYLFIEAAFPDDRSWWWSFRIAPFQPQGAVDSEVYRFSNMRQYINSIYLRGAQMLHNLRQDLGDEAFFELLRAYINAGADQINQPRDFWGLLSPEAAELTRDTRTEFLEDPGVDALFSYAAHPE